MTTRTIAHIETATNEMVGTFKIKNVLPTRNLKQVDPFLLIHHMQPYDLQPGTDTRIPPHPHAGFEVITYILDGEFFHRDSKGYDQTARSGDVNRMTSGQGIVHSEGPTAAFAKQGGKLQLLQVWINLPANLKKQEATFKHYDAASMPEVLTEKTRLKVVMGNYDRKQSLIDMQTPMFFYHIKIKAGELMVLPVEENHSAAFYIMNGSIKVLNETAKAGQLIHFETNGNQLAFTATEDTELVAFGGEPIKEKVVSYGPFVMNSFEEIQQSIMDYEAGKMGVLES